jgi:hypothetical protein
MAFRLSTGLRTALLDNGDDFKALMNNGWLDIYTGYQPATADSVETGTKLVRISSTCGIAVGDGCDFGTAAAGILPIAASPAWQGTVIAAGVAGWFRYYGSSGTGGATGSSSTALRFDGAVGVAGADLNLSHTNLVVGSVVTITATNITQPAE